MRIRTVISLIFTALAAVVVSCTKETEATLAGGAKKVAYIGISARNGGPSDTRASIGSDLKVAWEAGDDIFYYTGRYTSGADTPTSTEGTWKVPAPGTGSAGPILSVKLPVEYSDGDNRVTVLTKGKALGVVAAANLNSLTVTGGVPASQDGRFASTYLAACEGDLLALAQSTDAAPNNLTMSCLQSYICFSLSNLTVGDRTVNRIEITGTSDDGGDAVCGDIAVTTTEGDAPHTVTVALSGTPGNRITIDKTDSKFTANEKIYVAVLPHEYESFDITLYNGSTRLATVPVKQKDTEEKIDVTQGKMVDIGEINPHAKVTSTADKFTMFPEKVAITSERPTKQLWLKIEPSDFNGRVVWNSSDESIATVPQEGEIMENVPGIGKCISVTVTNKKVKTLGRTDINYNLETKVDGVYKDFPVTITATVYDPEDNTTVIVTKTCEITVGDFLDLGTRTVDGKRCLWARHVLKADPTGTEMALMSQHEKYASYSYNGQTHFGWGEKAPKVTRDEPMCFLWGNEYFRTQNKYTKYNSKDNLPYLQRENGEFTDYGIDPDGDHNTVDDAAARWNPVCHMPMTSDVAALLNNCTWTPADWKLTSNLPGYTDCSMVVVNWSSESGNASSGYYGKGFFVFWTAEYDHGYSENAILADFGYERSDTTPSPSPTLRSENKFRRANVRPVKYVD